MEVVTTAVRKSEEPEPNKTLTYREKVLKLAEGSAPLDLDALRTDLFEADEELEEFIAEIYQHGRNSST